MPDLTHPLDLHEPHFQCITSLLSGIADACAILCTGYSDEDSGSEPDTPSFAMAAPSGLSDDDSSSGGDGIGSGGSGRGGAAAAAGGGRCPAAAGRASTPRRRRGGSRAASVLLGGGGGGGGIRRRAGPTAADLSFELRHALQVSCISAVRWVRLFTLALAGVGSWLRRALII